MGEVSVGTHIEPTPDTVGWIGELSGKQLIAIPY
jgi:hypothetical protein